MNVAAEAREPGIEGRSFAKQTWGVRMIKVIAAAQRHPTNRELADFHNYWGESHGPLFANTRNLRRYVQHLTLPEAYGMDPVPTFDGVSMFWFDDFRWMPTPNDDPEVVALFDAVLADDRQLFDRSTEWPTHQRTASVTAVERVIVDGTTSPEMVKAIFIVSRRPGLTVAEFFDHWENHHGPMTAKVPGLRRYVQNHGIPEAQAARDQTHDGWAEMWFDDIAALQSAVKSPEWEAARKDAETLFTDLIGVGVARERVQRELDWTYNDWGVSDMSEDDVRERLTEQGYETLAADPDAPRKIKSAAATNTLAVWTREHIVTFDEPRIDARPDR
jgi:uncharacterized protein (TIGR02118 family)